METIGCYIVPDIEIGSEYLTYKEWKQLLSQRLITIMVGIVRYVSTLPIRNGNMENGSTCRSNPQL